MVEVTRLGRLAVGASSAKTGEAMASFGEHVGVLGVSGEALEVLDHSGDGTTAMAHRGQGARGLGSGHRCLESKAGVRVILIGRGRGMKGERIDQN